MKSQLKFDDLRQANAFGGDLLKKAKNRHARPMSSKDPVHLTLRSTKAKGRLSFLHTKNQKRVRETVEKSCAKYGVRLKQYANSGNHLHMLLFFPSREIYKRFIRALTSRLSMLITGAKKLARLTEKFWDRRPFTRIVRGLRGYKIASNYVKLNELEAKGVIPHRDGRLKDLLEHERCLFDFL